MRFPQSFIEITMGLLTFDCDTLDDVYQKIMYYSQLLTTQTFKGSRKKFKFSGVSVIGSLKQITISNEISKWMGRKGNQATKCTGMDTEFELE